MPWLTRRFIVTPCSFKNCTCSSHDAAVGIGDGDVVDRRDAVEHRPLVGRLGQALTFDESYVVVVHVVYNAAVEAHGHARDAVGSWTEVADLLEAEQVAPEVMRLLDVTDVEHQVVHPARSHGGRSSGDLFGHVANSFVSVTVSRSGTPSAGVALAYYAPAQVGTAAVRCAAVDPGLPGEPRLGLALSGGGHRAAVWAAGAVLGLVDAGEAKHIVSASSVSGGSIANGVIVASGDLRSASRADVEAWLKPGLQQWAHSGLFFSGPSTDRWVAGTLGLLIAALAAVVAALTATVSASRSWATSTVIWVSVGLLAGMVVLVGLFARRMPGEGHRHRHARRRRAGGAVRVPRHHCRDGFGVVADPDLDRDRALARAGDQALWQPERRGGRCARAHPLRGRRWTGLARGARRPTRQPSVLRHEPPLGQQRLSLEPHHVGRPRHRRTADRAHARRRRPSIGVPAGCVPRPHGRRPAERRGRRCRGLRRRRLRQHGRPVGAGLREPTPQRRGRRREPSSCAPRSPKPRTTSSSSTPLAGWTRRAT